MNLLSKRLICQLDLLKQDIKNEALTLMFYFYFKKSTLVTYFLKFPLF